MNWDKLTEEFGYDPRDLIRQEFADFKEKMYKGLSKEERKKYGMVYTPADVSIKMIDKFGIDSLEGQTILDPCCGSGNLLVACLLAGADADKLFGNELNRKMVRLARRRIQDICTNIEKYPHIRNREKFINLHYHIHVGDATNPYCLTHFNSRYNYHLTTSQGKTDTDYEDDDTEPHPEDALLTDGIGAMPKNSFAEILITNLNNDTSYPMAEENEYCTIEDYEDILSDKNTADKIIQDFNKQFKQPKISNKIKVEQDTQFNSVDLFGGF